MRTVWLVAIVALSALTARLGCGGCNGDEKKRHTLEESKMVGASEARALAKAQGVDPVELRCGAIGDSQAFTCRTDLGQTQVDKLVSGWTLSPDDPADLTIMRGKKFGCERFVEFSGDASAPFKAWGSKEKPAAVGGMQYARIYYRGDIGRACVEMERLPK